MFQKEFAERVTEIVRNNGSVIGLAVAGSWLTSELDEFSDLDLILVTKDKVSGDKEKMLAYASKFGQLLTGFTGEHVGEPRLLICLYDNPLLHVDIKFLTLPEFASCVETPVVLHDTDRQLENTINTTTAKYPYPDHQWIEDRFWIWVHYATVKIGRGEYFEALDFLGFLRMVVLGPLLHIKNGNLPKGVRKVETQLTHADLEQLCSTVAVHQHDSIITALKNAIVLYQALRTSLFEKDIQLHVHTEERVLAYLETIKARKHK